MGSQASYHNLSVLLAAMALVQPKKPVGGAYGVFLAEKRPEYTKACAGQKASAISTMAGAEWKKLSEAQKAPYVKKYETAKAQYDKDMEAFLAGGGVKEKGVAALRTEKRKAKDGKKKKDPNAPKRPGGGAYGVWLAENRPKIVSSLPQGHKMTDVAKAAGEQWKALSDAAKKPYEAKYAKKQEEYEKAMEDYKKANPDSEDHEEEENEEEDETPAEEENGAQKKKARKAG